MGIINSKPQIIRLVFRTQESWLSDSVSLLWRAGTWNPPASGCLQKLQPQSHHCGWATYLILEDSLAILYLMQKTYSLVLHNDLQVNRGPHIQKEVPEDSNGAEKPWCLQMSQLSWPNVRAAVTSQPSWRPDVRTSQRNVYSRVCDDAAVNKPTAWQQCGNRARTIMYST